MRMEGLELFSRWADEHVPHEESVVCPRADDTDIDPIAFVPSCEAVDDVYSISCVQVVNGTLTVDFPDLPSNLSAPLDID